MKRAEKIVKQRTSYRPISIVWVLRTGIAVAGFALWGWWFVAVVVGIRIAFALLETVLSFLLFLLVFVAIITLIITLIF